jgi:hypothetical protein
MTCDEARNLAWLAEDGEPLPADAAGHLDDCPACRAVLDDRRHVSDACRALGEAPLPAPLRDRVLRAASARPAPPPSWRWAAAAAAAFLVAAGWGAWWLRRPAPVPALPVAPDAAFAFDAPRATVESRLDALERDLELLPVDTSNRTYTTYTRDSWGIDDLRQRIEALERSLEAAQPERRDPGQGAAPVGPGPRCAC